MMDKKPILILHCLALLFMFTAGLREPEDAINNKNIIKNGSGFSDFIIGMKENTVYRLRDLLGRRFIVLAFLDSSAASGTLTARIIKNIGSIIAVKPGLLWLNITMDKHHAEIHEITSVLKIRYRTLSENIPRGYSSGTRPAVFIMDPNGIIQFIYIGYSPTIMNDIKNWLRGTV